MIYIYQQGAIIFFSYKITIATLQPLSRTPNFNFVCLLLESELGDPVFFFLQLNCELLRFIFL